MGAVPTRLKQVMRAALLRTPARELLVRRRAGRYLTVLAYHRVHPPVGPDYPFNPGVFEATPEEFAGQLRYLRRNFDVLSVRELVAGLDDPDRLPPRPALVTFDDGYADNCDYAVPLLREAGVPACFFLITGLIGTATAPWPDEAACCFRFSRAARFESPFGPADPPYETTPERRRGSLVRYLRNAKQVPDARRREFLARLREATGVNPEEHVGRPLLMSWDDARALKGQGMELGGHTRTHPALAGIAEPAALRDEIQGCADDLARETGSRPQAFAYPFGIPATLSPAAEAEVARAGFRAAFSYCDAFAPRPPAGNPFCIPRLKPGRGYAGFRRGLATGTRPEQ